LTQRKIRLGGDPQAARFPFAIRISETRAVQQFLNIGRLSLTVIKGLHVPRSAGNPPADRRPFARRQCNAIPTDRSAAESANKEPRSGRMRDR